MSPAEVHAHRVVIVDAFHDWGDGFELERSIWAGHDIAVTVRHCEAEEELVEASLGADAVVTMGLRTPFTASVIAALPRCRVIARYGVGVDSIDVAAATEQGILVTHTPDYCTAEVADHAVAMLLTWARRIIQLDGFVRDGNWTGSIQFTGPLPRLSTITLGLVGFGRIGQEVARRAAAIVGRILAHDPNMKPDVADEYGVRLVGLDDLLSEADCVSLHVPLNPGTEHLIGSRELAQMKPTACLINTSRGRVVDEKALISALESRRLAGTALDVVASEPLPSDSPLRSLPNVILTPHFASYSTHAVRELRQSVANAVVDVLEGTWPSHPVKADVEPCSPLRQRASKV